MRQQRQTLAPERQRLTPEQEQMANWMTPVFGIFYTGLIGTVCGWAIGSTLHLYDKYSVSDIWTGQVSSADQMKCFFDAEAGRSALVGFSLFAVGFLLYYIRTQVCCSKNSGVLEGDSTRAPGYQSNN